MKRNIKTRLHKTFTLFSVSALIFTSVLAAPMAVFAKPGSAGNAKANEAATTAATAEADTPAASATAATAAETEWGCYIYMIGTDLESDGGSATNNIEELLKAPKSDDVRYIVELGGASEWNNEYGDSDRVKRFIIQGGEIECVYDEPLTNMSQPENFADFITWAKQNYPSKKTMLDIWDHGGAVTGIGWNELYERDHLSVPDLAYALKSSGVHFDLLGFDACLMADFDVLYNLRSYADYIVASEEIEMGLGWDYKGFATLLSRNPTCSARTLGKYICNTYEDNFTANSNGFSTTSTLSLIETSKLKEVKRSLESFTEAMIDLMEAENAAKNNESVSDSIDPDYFRYLLLATNDTKHYYYQFERDLVSLAVDAAPYVGEEIAADLIDAVRDAVIHRTQFDESSYNNGISFFWGFSAEPKLLNIYSKIVSVPRYLALIDACNYGWNAPVSLYKTTKRIAEPDYLDYHVKLGISENKTEVDSLIIEEGARAVRSVTYGLYSRDENDNTFQIAEMGNVAVDNNGSAFTAKFGGKVASINGNNIVMKVARETDDYILYDIPVYSPLLGNGQQMLRAAFYKNADAADELNIDDLKDQSIAPWDQSEADKWIGEYGDGENGYFELIGIVNDYDSSAGEYPDRSVYDLGYGFDLQIVYPQVDGFSTTGYVLGETFTFDRDTAIEMIPLPDGDYELSYNVGTVFCETKTSDLIPITIKDGELIPYEASDADAANADAAAGSGSSGNADNNGNGKNAAADDAAAVEYCEFKLVTADEYYAEAKAAEEKAVATETDMTAAAPKDKVTVMFYLDGANLEEYMGYSTTVLGSMLQAKDSEDVNFLLTTGGSRSWNNNAIDNNAMQRFEIHGDTLVEMEKYPLTNMGDPQTLAEFLKWGADNYPAEHYAVFLFDHGGAWSGCESDDVYDGASIDLNGLDYAFDYSGVHFDDIVFNCCLMSNLTVASHMAEFGDYMVASEEAMFAVPFRLTSTMNYIVRNADHFDAERLGKQAVNMLTGSIETSMREDGISGAFQCADLLDLSKIKEVVKAVDEMGLEMTKLLDDPAGLTALTAKMSSTRSYVYPYLKDTVSLARNVSGIISEKVCDRVENAVEDAVVYMVSNSNFAGSNGLSITFDSDGSLNGDSMNEYAEICPAKNYLAFLDAINLGWHAYPGTYETGEVLEGACPTDYRIMSDLVSMKDIEGAAGAEDGTTIGLKITEGIDVISDVTYQVEYYDEETDAYYGISELGNLRLITASEVGSGTSVIFEETFDGRAIFIDDAMPYFTVTERGEGYSILSAPVIVYGDGYNDEYDLRVAYTEEAEPVADDVLTDAAADTSANAGAPESTESSYSFDLENIDLDKGEFRILGIFSKSGPAAINSTTFLQKLEDGAMIVFLRPAFDIMGNDLGYVEGDYIIYNNETDVNVRNLEDGDYLVRFAVTDGLLRKSYSDGAYVSMNRGRIQPIDIVGEEEFWASIAGAFGYEFGQGEGEADNVEAEGYEYAEPETQPETELEPDTSVSIGDLTQQELEDMIYTILQNLRKEYTQNAG
ncbi:MAG: clostripain-related cysteine peptidase [Eubacteriales bacterium]|nr:clostripain-related cysteine peptidase [Eubacteriales bacterium]